MFEIGFFSPRLISEIGEKSKKTIKSVKLTTEVSGQRTADNGKSYELRLDNDEIWIITAIKIATTGQQTIALQGRRTKIKRSAVTAKPRLSRVVRLIATPSPIGGGKRLNRQGAENRNAQTLEKFVLNRPPAQKSRRQRQVGDWRQKQFGFPIAVKKPRRTLAPFGIGVQHVHHQPRINQILHRAPPLLEPLLRAAKRTKTFRKPNQFERGLPFRHFGLKANLRRAVFRHLPTDAAAGENAQFRTDIRRNGNLSAVRYVRDKRLAHLRTRARTSSADRPRSKATRNRRPRRSSPRRRARA